jgi:hypothetical protein
MDATAAESVGDSEYKISLELRHRNWNVLVMDHDGRANSV